MSSKEFTVVVPAYNEMGRIDKYLPKLVETLDRYLEGKYEVIVVTDGCTDGTEEWVREYCIGRSHLTHLNFRIRLGKGGAIVEGFKVARGKYIAFVDADGSVPPEEVIKLLIYMKRSSVNLVMGSRYLKNSITLSKPPLLRTLYSRTFNVLLKIIFPDLIGIRDTQCGVKVIDKDTLRRLLKLLRLTSFSFDVNLIHSVVKIGGKVKEIPIKWYHVDIGSKVLDSRLPLRSQVTILTKLGIQMVLDLIILKLEELKMTRTYLHKLLKKLAKILEIKWQKTKEPP